MTRYFQIQHLPHISSSAGFDDQVSPVRPNGRHGIEYWLSEQRRLAIHLELSFLAQEFVEATWWSLPPQSKFRRHPSSVDADPRDTVWSHTFPERRGSTQVTAEGPREQTNAQTAGNVDRVKKNVSFKNTMVLWRQWSCGCKSEL